MKTTWPFDQPRDCASITTRFVIEDNHPITFVSHDADDHGWQFHSDDDADVGDGMIVALECIVDLDPSVLEVADIPPGWVASRPSANAVWIKEVNPRNVSDD